LPLAHYHTIYLIVELPRINLMFNGLKIILSLLELSLTSLQLLQEFLTSLLLSKYHKKTNVATPLWGSCEVATHTPENGTWESSGTLKNSERNCRGQNTLHWGVLYTFGKVLKCKCWKWPRMSHLDICSTSYGRKKGRELNWQFDSRPQKVKNRPDSGACRWSATHHWKAFEESYNFGLDLVPIQVWGEKLWAPKVSGVQTETVLGLHFGSPGKKSHLDASPAKSCREYYMGEGGGFPRVWAVMSQVSPRSPVSCLNTENVQNEF